MRLIDPIVFHIRACQLYQTMSFILFTIITHSFHGLKFIPYPVQEVRRKLTISTTAPIPKYSHTTLLFDLPRKVWVVRPTKTYIAEAKPIDQIVVGVGQKDKLKASSPSTRLKIKLLIHKETDTRSSIEIVQSICRIIGKHMADTRNPFHRNNKLNAYITLNMKKTAIRVKRKFAVEAAL